jgi:hypothetical protein
MASLLTACSHASAKTPRKFVISLMGNAVYPAARKSLRGFHGEEQAVEWASKI